MFYKICSFTAGTILNDTKKLKIVKRLVPCKNLVISPRGFTTHRSAYEYDDRRETGMKFILVVVYYIIVVF